MTPGAADQPLTLDVGEASDQGRVRDANEDALLRDDDNLLFVVADGMGGHRAGEVASSTAIEALQAHLGGGDPLEAAIEAANASVFAKAQDNPDMRGMGTTLTAMRVEDGSARIGHVGDSRAYLLRDGQLTQVTEDHSLVEELVREGRLTPDEAAVHPQRSIITRAIGVDAGVEVATYEIDLRGGDRIVLCSDGLTSMVRDDDILGILEAESDPQAAAEHLVEAANDAGGDDNVTVMVVDVVGDADAERARALAASRAAPADAGEPTGEWEPLPADLDDGDVEPAEDGDAGTDVPRRRRWRRVALSLVLVLVVAVAAVAAVGWYARNNYFVGFEGERVALFQGVPDGLLVWDPTVEVRSRLTADHLSEADFEEVRDDKRFSSRGSAEDFVERLRRKALSTTTTTTTTTTEPGATTTTDASGTTGATGATSP